MNLNIDIQEAVNGKDAVDKYEKAIKKNCKCKHRAPKLILMDIQMPVMDGITASEKILELMRQYSS